MLRDLTGLSNAALPSDGHDNDTPTTVADTPTVLGRAAICCSDEDDGVDEPTPPESETVSEDGAIGAAARAQREAERSCVEAVKRSESCPNTRTLCGRRTVGLRPRWPKVTELPQIWVDALDGVRHSEVLVCTERTFYCPICMAYQDTNCAHTLQCGHQCCVCCFKDYISSRIAEGQISFHCFHVIPPDPPSAPAPVRLCNSRLDESEFVPLLDHTVVQKYRRYKRIREEPTCRSCPKCDHLVSSSGGGWRLSGGRQADMTCDKCGYRFCYFHADAHPGMTCAAHERLHRHEERANRTVIATTCKPCPGCSQPVEKAGGCNHMICTNCGVSFCWICGRKVGEGQFPFHYAWWNVLGCPTRQMADRDEPWSPLQALFYRGGFLLMLLVLGPAALALTMVSLPLVALTIYGCCRAVTPLTRRKLYHTPFSLVAAGLFTFWGYVIICLIAPVFFFLYQASVCLYHLTRGCYHGVMHLCMLMLGAWRKEKSVQTHQHHHQQHFQPPPKDVEMGRVAAASGELSSVSVSLVDVM
ncbi:unnamed protein product [Vitrella brassicaformis CCMP3155]|uniref:RBR-type E3 ubiquitin transferase n=1 Tax=Vitrella brassicaformis (strain CCMP3155) TaxID=1169540 RepID=A0A0G4ERA5_VITBC|nr:unnamed protein product [Vitrella brassicaformis CCMP3155]|mmetsp:Transcript_4274/g.9756  ORF Transcript_4274/g.9756 Transcript_4274/m.9756 type:complete len:529 (-) Transcript_4274:1309-2895(-)|eukprot:CEL99806.1 unnamed protein product [Vitrella brassicaformis CCMP3155]